ncbi:MAG: PQQ-binding-like beta-propeller repeat protein [Planctomycetota bacterium]
MRIVACASLLLAAPLVGQAATMSWPQFLGAGGTARAVGASTLSFDRASDLRYRVALPPGESSPCIVGDRIFLTGFDGEQLVMLALDRDSGEELWRHGVPGPESMEFQHVDAGIAMPSACATDELAFFYFPSYGLIARRYDGELAWEMKLEDPKPGFGIGTSPMIFDGKLFLLRDGCPEAKLYALDPATGDEVWSVPRPTFRDSHATPFVWHNEQRIELIIASTGTVMALDPQDGTELWRVEGLTPLICTTPTASADRLYFAGWSTISAAGPDRLLAGMEEPLELTDEERDDPKKLFARLDANGDEKLVEDEIPAGRIKTVFSMFDRDGDGAVVFAEWAPLMRMPQMGKNLMVAIKPGGAGDVTETHVEWSTSRGIPYVSSPLLYDGRLYLVKAGGVLSCIDAATGKPRFRRSRLSDHSEYYASPIGVDGHIVICSSAGTVYVLEAADELKIAREVAFDERIFATPAVVDGTVYLRTRQALYAFAK